MNVEENRLRTFNEWPSDTEVSPARIAKAGFFAINDARTVQCFACGVRISEWNYGDQVMAKHRRLSPQCPFVLDPSTSGNVPKVSSTSAATRNHTVTDPRTSLADESVRLQTFINWPIPEIVTPESLARAGFYFLHQSDKTKCAFCDGVVGSWEVGDDPDREHRRHFPNCPFVQLVINPRLQTETDASVATNSQQQKNPTVANLHLVSQPNFYELGIQAHTAPKRPRFATLESRLNSFTAWPTELIQTPEILAQAGFYYEGRGDQVRCFHCDGGLRHWDPQDDPWTEHARWFPRCSYVKLVKGQEFVDACAIEQNSGSNLEEVHHKSPTTPTQRKEITDRELQLHMISPPALAALEVGLHVGRVKQALREKLARTGAGFSSADALIEATLNLQRDEEDISTAENESPPVPQAMSNFLEAILEDVVPQQQTETRRQEVAKTEVKKPKEQEVVKKEVKEEKKSETTSVVVVNKTLSLEEENRLLKEARLCKICMDNEVGIVFLPCGHLASCVNCAPNLQDCPVCRSAIKATVRTFLS